MTGWYAAAVVCWGIATLGGMVAFWKSATLSPDAIQRRVYWTGCGLALILILIATMPDWRGGLFLSATLGVGMVLIALRFTNHVKIRGRIYAGTPNLRKADRPPAHAPDTEDQ